MFFAIVVTGGCVTKYDLTKSQLKTNFRGSGNLETLLAEKESIGTEEGLKRNYTGAISSGQAQKAITAKLGAILVELINSPECQEAIVN